MLASLDTVNAADPRTSEVHGRRGPKELLHAELVTAWVRRLDPGATHAQLVAAGAHHLRRWEHPRDRFPEGRAGYLRWRSAARRAHADAVAEILADHGVPEEFSDRVVQIVRKEGLGGDPAVQVHEDALCLVFLETQLVDVATRLGVPRATEVLTRTVAKMSPAAIRAARGLDLADPAAAMLDAALDAPIGGGSQ